MLIGVISDTHGLLRPEAGQRLAGVDHIIHAGDIGSPEIIPRLRSIAPTTAVRGNVDVQPWAMDFPARDEVTLAGSSVYVLHDIAELDRDPVAAGFRSRDLRSLASTEHRDQGRCSLPQPGQRRPATVQATRHSGDGDSYAARHYAGSSRDRSRVAFRNSGSERILTLPSPQPIPCVIPRPSGRCFGLALDDQAQRSPDRAVGRRAPGPDVVWLISSYAYRRSAGEDRNNPKRCTT